MIDFRQMIIDELTAQKMYKRTLAKRAGVPYSTLNTYLRGADTGSETVAKLLDVLGLDKNLKKFNFIEFFC